MWVLAGAALGLLAFLADALDDVPRAVATAVTSSGLAWGLAAFLAGRSTAGRRAAVVRATGTLVSATLVYYLLVVFVSRRWSGGTLEDGSSADMHGLRSVALMTAVWLAGSLVAGPLLGLLGHAVRTGSPRWAAGAAGVACGLLSAEGWAGVAPWRLPLDEPFYQAVAAATAVRIVLPFAVLGWLATRHRLWTAWPVLAGAAVAAGAGGAVLWRVLLASVNA
ncbi:DUF6518 family protein [Dactylosporangium sp. AC04546]|uniref:DUF6518 family protein n=1 Tax=Dactylosporangium sp. AC04546 TaxID=2862460 RepID=UPI001EE11F79|nr:DUF6518 family protein [Dactylosporangium sp. AC04546]WVK89750.1 DUF6518 family protein [Dactylosporangium sp. AC04546]